MVTPKIGQTKAAITPKTGSIRDALGKTDIRLETRMPGTTTSIQVMQSTTLKVGGRSVASDAKRFDVSVGKTWATDLVSAAQRDAHLVPFRLLGDKTNPMTPAFAAAGTTSNAGTTLLGPNKPDNAMQASADMLSVVSVLLFPTESMADIARRLQRSNLGVVINTLVEFFRSPDRVASADELVHELEAIGALEGIRQLLSDEASTILEYVSRLPGRLAIPDIELQQVMRQITIKLSDSRALAEAYRFLGLIGDAAAIDQQVTQTSRAIDTIIGIRPSILPTVTPAEIIENRETVPGIIASRLYEATNPKRIIKILGETRFYPLTEDGWQKIGASNVMLIDVVTTRIIEGLEEMERASQVADHRGSPDSRGQMVFSRYRKNQKIVARLIPVLRALGKNEETQPLQRHLDNLVRRVSARIGDPMKKIHAQLTAHASHPRRILGTLEVAMLLIPTDAEWQKIKDDFPRAGQVLSFEVDHAVGQLTLTALEIEMTAGMGASVQSEVAEFDRLHRGVQKLMGIAENFVHPVELEAYRSTIESAVFAAEKWGR